MITPVSGNACLAFSRDSQSATSPSRSRISIPARSPTSASSTCGRAKRGACCTKLEGQGQTSAHPQASAGARRTTSTQRNSRSAKPLSHRNTQDRTPKIPHPHNRKNKEKKIDKDRHSPTKQLPTSAAVCGPGRREPPSRRERTDGAVLRLGFARAFVRSVVIVGLWCCAGRG
jgi:hypothetical protein